MKKRLVLGLILGVLCVGGVLAMADFSGPTVDDGFAARADLAAAMLELPAYGYDIRCIALRHMDSMLAGGDVDGFSALWTVANAFGCQYSPELSLHENADRLARFLTVRRDWYSPDGNGILAFLYSMNTAVSENAAMHEFGVVWAFGNDSFECSFPAENLTAIVSALAETEELYGLTVPELYDLLTQAYLYYDLF